MLAPELRPHKAVKVGDRLTLEEAYERDIDIWGNGERKLYHTLSLSLADFLVKNVRCVRDNTFVYWLDIGCGPGYFLEGICDSMVKVAGPRLIPSGVDISEDALVRCRSLWGVGTFTRVNLDEFPLPKIAGSYDVVSFVDVFQCLQNYRKTFDDIYNQLAIGTIIVIGDNMIRSNPRDYPKKIDTVALLGEWTDYTMSVTTPDEVPHRNRYIKYKVYQKMA